MIGRLGRLFRHRSLLLAALGLFSATALHAQVRQVNFTGITPTAVSAGSPDTQLTLTGVTNYIAEFDEVCANTTALTVTSTQPTSLVVTVPAALLSPAGDLEIYITAFDGCGNGPDDNSSGIQYLYVNSPHIYNVNPGSALVGSANTNIKVIGHDFVPGVSVVTLTSSEGIVTTLTTAVNDAGHLTAVVPASVLATQDSVAVGVQNGAGNISDSSGAFIIYAPAATNLGDSTALATPASEPAMQSGAAVFTATVATTGGNQTQPLPGVPSGTVTFQNGATVLGTGKLALNPASLSLVSEVGGVFQDGSVPSAAIKVDLNGDGYDDLIFSGGEETGGAFVSLSTGPAAAGVSLGQGSGFQPPYLVFDSTSGPYCPAQGFAVGDLNRDGNADLVVACLDDTLVLYGNGDGTFDAPVPLQEDTPTPSIGIGVADVNGDGNLDLIVISNSSDFSSVNGAGGQVFFGDGEGDFTPGTQYAVSSALPNIGFAYSATFADFDGDGILDVALLEGGPEDSSTVFYVSTIFRVANDGSFSEITNSAHDLTFQVNGFVAGDVNGDGKPDLALGDFSNGQVDVMINSGLGVVSLPTAVTSSGLPTVAVGIAPTAPGKSNAFNLAYAAFNNDAGTLVVTGLQVTQGAGGTLNTATVFNSTLTGMCTECGALPVVPIGDWDGDGWNDLVIGAAPQDSSFAYSYPFYTSGAATTSLTGVNLPAANYTLTAAYLGNAQFQAENSNFPFAVTQLTPTVTWNPPAAITYGTTLSAAQLDATTTIPGTFAYTPAAGTVLGAGVQTLSVTFTPTDNVNYTVATQTVQLQVNQATPAITWTTPAAITYGAALSATQLDATSPVAGTLVYTPAAGTVLGAGMHTLSVTLTPTDAADYAPATQTVQLQVNQATPAITWTTPAAITYGAALSATQLNATSPVAGTFVYTPAVGTVLGAGAHTLSVTLTPTDAADYTPATQTVQLQVNRATPTVTWATPAAITYGTALSTAQLDATPSVPGTLVYTPAAGTILGAGAHTLSVTLTPTDAADYNPATQTVQLQVNKATPTVTWATPAAITYGTALGAAQLDATPSVPGALVYTPAAGTVLGAGAHTLSVTLTPTDAADYTTAGQTVQLQVNKATPTITWATPAAITYGTALSATQLNATSPVAGTFAYTPAAGTVLGAGAHTLSVTLTPTDAADYNPATQTVQLQVNKATPTITWATPAAITYGTALSAAQLDATPSVPGTLVYTPAAGTVLGAGAHTLSVTLTPTDAADYNPATQTVQLQVNKATPTITWATPAAITYGTTLSAAQLDATPSVAGALAYTPAAGTVLGAGAHTLSVTLTPTDAADYNPATQTVQLQVNKATPTIAWATPAAVAYGTALSTTQLNATSAVAGTFAYTPAAGTVLGAGAHTLSVTLTPTDTADYNPATQTVQLQVNKATPTITWATPAAITYGSALGAAQLNATSSIPGTFAYTPSAGTVLGAGAHTLSVTLTPTDAADYNPATQTVQLQVNKATPTITWATPAAITYGSALGAAQLNATSSIPGTFAYTPSAGTVLGAGAHTLSVTLTPTDAADYTTATQTVQLKVSQATPTITWATPAAITYGAALGSAQLDATSAVPGTLVYTPAAGTILTAGAHTLSVALTPTDTADYTTAKQTVQLQVSQATPLINWPVPAALDIGSPIGSAQLDATSPVPGTFTYTPPSGTIPQTPGELTLSTVFTPTDTTDYTTAKASVPLSVVVPPAKATLSGPPSAAPGTQEDISFQLVDPYPVQINGVFTLTVQPDPALGVDDPFIQFATGGRTYSFTIPPNSTSTPQVEVQSGTVESAISVSVDLTAAGEDVTPAGLQPVVIQVPAAAPALKQATLTRDGNSLTVTVVGYSSTREITQAVFTFSSTAGHSLTDPTVTIPVGSDFSTWYQSQNSDQYGSQFTYTQNFSLTEDASTIGSVTVTLTNSIGESNVESAQ